MDFYWHYSGKETIDDAGKFNFIRAIKVGKQVFAALTEYIQVSIYIPTNEIYWTYAIISWYATFHKVMFIYELYVTSITVYVMFTSAAGSLSR